MRILLIHNRYLYRGGEDQVFESEGDLLTQNGHAVQRIVFDNSAIRTLRGRLAAAMGMIYNRSSKRRVEEKILSFRPDVIHVHNFWPLASPAVFFAAGKYDVPVVLTLHNYRLICPSATLFHRGDIYEKSIHSIFPMDAVIKGVYRDSSWQTAAVAATMFVHSLLGTWRIRIDRYVVLTSFARTKFEQSKLAIPPRKFALKPNCVKDHGSGAAHRKNWFLFVGRLTAEKGIQTVLQAARDFGFRLIIMGDGPCAAEVREAARVNLNIEYQGQKDRNEVIAALKQCKALIFPSVWYEGFPVSILDAFATGTPVITSRLGSMREIVSHELNGLHFDPGDARDLGRRVLALLNDEALAVRLGHSARRTYERFFTPEKNYRRLMEIYEEARLERHSAAPRKIPGHRLSWISVQTEDERSLPLVTIGIPTYNGGRKLVKAFNSIVGQGYPNVEILISDNGSEDDTPSVCQELLSRDPRLIYFRHPKNMGIVANFEFLLRRARGKYFMWVADDDTLAEGALPVYIDYMESNHDYSVVSGKIEYIQNGSVSFVEEGFNFAQRSPLLRVLLYYLKVIYGGMFHGLMRREMAAKIGVKSVIGSDWHFVASLAFLGKMKNFDFVGYRKHFGGASRSFENYAKMIGESRFAGKYPYVKISGDAYREAATSPVYASVPRHKKLLLAATSSAAVLLRYYLTIYPFVIGGGIKRLMKRTISYDLNGPLKSLLHKSSLSGKDH